MKQYLLLLLLCCPLLYSAQFICTTELQGRIIIIDSVQFPQPLGIVANSECQLLIEVDTCSYQCHGKYFIASLDRSLLSSFIVNKLYKITIGLSASGDVPKNDVLRKIREIPPVELTFQLGSCINYTIISIEP